MTEEKRIRYFAIGLTLSFVGFLLGVSAIPLMRTTAFEPRGAESQQALLYRISHADIPRDVALATEGKAIEVDLDRMKLRLIMDGEVVRSLPVLSRGREGTFWETPQGNYSVISKQPKHYSSIGGVWMPYSIQFFGNFFIHGWPYSQDGEPVPPGYSGGCIRLSTEDAEEVYLFADHRTPVRVTGADAEATATTTFRYYLKGEDASPEISSSALLVADIENGIVLWEKDSSTPLPAHGVTALMSSLAAVETVDQYKTVRMSELLLGKPIPRKVEAGFLDEIPIGALVYPLLFDANDFAARAFSVDHGERAFVRAMNEKAKAIGMQDTEFASSTGSAANLLPARDAFVLARYIRENKPFLLSATLRDEHIVNETNGKERFQWSNDNPWFLADARYRGGILPEQNGEFSSAIGIWSLPLSEFGSRSIVFIALNSRFPQADIDRMREYVEQQYIYAPDTADYITLPIAGRGEKLLQNTWDTLRQITERVGN